jgi:hypothetical protein
LDVKTEPVNTSVKPVGLGLKSLRSVTSEVKTASTVASQKFQSDREHNLEEIKTAWNSYTEEILSNDIMVQSVFRMAELIWQGNNCLEVRVPGSTQVLVVNEKRGALADYMRERFGIQGVDMSVVKTAVTDVAIEYQTDKQKYERLVKEYPLLEEMRKRLKLRIDY